MKKRGDITALSLLELGLLVIFVIGAVIIGIWIAKLLQPSMQGNFESFKTLSEGIQKLSESDESACWDHFLITDDVALAGFGKNDGEVTREDYLFEGGTWYDWSWGADETINRPLPPNKCPPDKSCLTICNIDSGSNLGAETDDCSNEDLLDAKIYQNITRFEYARAPFKYGDQTVYGKMADLLFFGSERGELEYFIIFKHGISPNQIITITRPEFIQGLVPGSNLLNCHNLGVTK